MAGLSDLVNNITNSVDDLVGKARDPNRNPAIPKYPDGSEYRAIQAQLNPGNWIKLSFPYTFSVVNLKDASGKNSPFTDFALPLNPQSINQKEPTAIRIKKSQGGSTVNHSGMANKLLNITGTTGISPFRGEGGVSAKTGEAIFQPNELKFKSGYEVFVHLRNWFRTYYVWKQKQGAAGQDYRLVFKNYKDGEFLIVELLDFEMDRQAAKSFLYDYKLEFEVLANFQFGTPTSKMGFLENADALIENALDKINTARAIFLRTQGILRQIESTYDSAVLEPLRQATLAIKAALGVVIVASDISSRVIVNTVSTAGALAMVAREALNTVTLGATGKSDTLAQINSLLDKRLFGNKNTLQKTLAATTTEIKQKGSGGLLKLGALMTQIDAGQFPERTLSETVKEQDMASALPRNFYENTIDSLERIKQNAEDFFGLGSPQYDQIFGRTATLSADVSKVVTKDEYDVLFGFNEAITGLNLLLSTTELFKSSFDERIADMNARFDGNLSLLANQAVRQMKLPAGISLERLAQQELGDSLRWGEIVEVNNLKAPYISDDPSESRDGVLRAGQNILIPSPIQNGFSQVPVGKVNKLTEGMSELERSLGVDFRLNADFDLILTPSGDIELIAGADNMAQGTLLKLSYEPGDVMLYPELGAGLSIGKKFPPLEEIKDRITNSLLQDSRIQRVADLSLQRDSSGLYIRFNLHIKQIDIPIPVKIKV